MSTILYGLVCHDVMNNLVCCYVGKVEKHCHRGMPRTCD